jgi:hypothetical protein
LGKIGENNASFLNNLRGIFVSDSFFALIELKEWESFFNTSLDKFCFRLGGETIVEKMNENHKSGVDYIKTNQTKILTTILLEVLKHYPKWQEKYGYDEDDEKDIMPNISTINDFANLIMPKRIHILSVYSDDFPYIGYDFDCTWDDEHGLGIMMLKDKIVKIGGGDISFLNWVAEEDRDKTNNSPE